MELSSQLVGLQYQQLRQGLGFFILTSLCLVGGREIKNVKHLALSALSGQVQRVTGPQRKDDQLRGKAVRHRFRRAKTFLP